MKKVFEITAAACLLMLFVSCKKETNSIGRSNEKSTIGFKYNGIHYNLTYTSSGTQAWSAATYGLVINRPDIFNGIIVFKKTGCAYLEPYEGAVFADASCNLTASGGGPIEPDVIYTYESGTYNYKKINCETKQGYDIITGSSYTYTICDGNGSFDLVLKNSEGKQLKLTNGSIKIFNQSE